jgi:hypothetical protein
MRTTTREETGKEEEKRIIAVHAPRAPRTHDPARTTQPHQQQKKQSKQQQEPDKKA